VPRTAIYLNNLSIINNCSSRDPFIGGIGDMAQPQGKSTSPIVEAKNRLVVAMQKETQGMKDNYEKLKTAETQKVKQYFAHQLQLFCGFVDGTKSICEAYFQKEVIPVTLIRAMEDYYTTLKVMLSEYPDVAMDEKLQAAVGKIFLPYKQVLSKMSKLADDYEEQKRQEAAAQAAPPEQ
jgi:hypothetical protein